MFWLLQVKGEMLDKTGKCYCQLLLTNCGSLESTTNCHYVQAFSILRGTHLCPVVYLIHPTQTCGYPFQREEGVHYQLYTLIYVQLCIWFIRLKPVVTPFKGRSGFNINYTHKRWNVWLIHVVFSYMQLDANSILLTYLKLSYPGQSLMFLVWGYRRIYIVKPVLRGHLWDKEKVAL